MLPMLQPSKVGTTLGNGDRRGSKASKQIKLQRSKTERQRTFENGIAEINRNAFHSVSSSRLAELESKRTLTTAQQEMIQKKASCKDYGSSFKIAVWSQDHDEKIKLQRAQGGCPGTIRRRRTWQAAKSYGEPQAGIDP